jgi:hypothetical protein
LFDQEQAPMPNPAATDSMIARFDLNILNYCCGKPSGRQVSVSQRRYPGQLVSDLPNKKTSAQGP